MHRPAVGSATGALVAILLTTACGSSKPAASSSAATPSKPHSSHAASALVIHDYANNQVRIARFDATDVGATTGTFDGVVAEEAIVHNGRDLLAMTAGGSVRTLGHLVATPECCGPWTVAVDPSLKQWIYTIADGTTWTSQIHVGTAHGDRVIATVPSPDGSDFYQAFAWNRSGVYLVKQQTGLGGVGPFLEYHFPLARLDLASGKINMVSPSCIAERVLDDGTLMCTTMSGGLEVRSPSGTSHVIQVAPASAGVASYSRLTLAPDQRHFAAARNGSTDPDMVNYQIVTGDLRSSAVGVFGPIDFYPDTWLPDGRLVADHLCWTLTGNSAPCDQSLDGAYFLSPDGQTRSLFYKLAPSSSVVGYL